MTSEIGVYLKECMNTTAIGRIFTNDSTFIFIYSKKFQKLHFDNCGISENFQRNALRTTHFDKLGVNYLETKLNHIFFT